MNRTSLAPDRPVVVTSSGSDTTTTQVRWARWSDVLAPLVVVAVALPMRLANSGSYIGKAD